MKINLFYSASHCTLSASRCSYFILTIMLSPYIFLLVKILVCLAEENQDGVTVLHDENIPVDPVAQIKQLLQQEMLESEQNREELKAQGVNVGEWYRDGMRAHGIDVEEWEDKLGFTLSQLDAGDVPDDVLQKENGDRHLHGGGEL